MASKSMTGERKLTPALTNLTPQEIADYLMSHMPPPCPVCRAAWIFDHVGEEGRCAAGFVNHELYPVVPKQ